MVNTACRRGMPEHDMPLSVPSIHILDRGRPPFKPNLRRAKMTVRALLAALTFLVMAPAIPPAAAQTANAVQTWPNLREGDVVFKDFAFASGEILPELKLHYRTLGTEKRNAAGEITNGVVLLHGTSGSGADWLRASLANAMVGGGQPV